MAERFHIIVEGNRTEPATTMIQISQRLRYRGPLLTEGERSTLRSSSSPGRSRALTWDTEIQHFIGNRPLPTDFETGPLRWQLATLAWSFHFEPFTRTTIAETPAALLGCTLDQRISGAKSLGVAVPSADRIPALSHEAAHSISTIHRAQEDGRRPHA